MWDNRKIQDIRSSEGTPESRDAEMTGLKHLCITLISPAWEPLSCKLLLGRSSGSLSFKNPIPSRNFAPIKLSV